MIWQVWSGRDVKISVVTISYNQAQFLERAICSILNQSYKDIEYIIVDPGSTDGSKEIIEAYRPRIARVILEPDAGPVDGLNKGFRYATGDIYCFLNADDELLPGALEKVASYFSTHPEVDVVCGHGYIVDEYNYIIRKAFSDSFSVRRYIYGGAAMLQQSTFFKRDTFRKVGGFNPENKTCWDGELMLDFGLHHLNIKVINDFLSVFRIHQSSITGTGRLNEQYQREQNRLFRKAKNRDKRWFDRLFGILARVEKHIRNPKSTVHRISSLGRTKVRVGL